MSGPGRDSRDPRWRPPDPAGTKPKHDPQSLLPQRREPLLPAQPQAQAADADDAGSALPAVRAAPPAASSTRWTPRFRLLLGVLLGIGVVAVAAVVLLVMRGEDAEVVGPAWSGWVPVASGDAGAMEIAGHVSPAYKLSDGRQLVQVGAGSLEVDGVPLDVAVRHTPEEGGGVDFYDDGGVLYRMCGLGVECSIASGKPTPQRHLLLRREGLELALYSLHYLGAKSVVVLMPPARGESPNQALFFRRDDLAPLLARPLSASLMPRRLTPATVRRSPDAALVHAVTLPRLFTFSLTRGNTEGRGILVLEPIGAAPAQRSGSSTTSSG